MNYFMFVYFSCLRQIVNIEYSFIAKRVGKKLLIIDYRERSVKEISIQDLIVGPFLASAKSILL